MKSVNSRGRDIFKHTISGLALWMAMFAGLSGLPAAPLESPHAGALRPSLALDVVWVVADFDGDLKPDLVSVNSLGRGDAIQGNDPRMHSSPLGLDAFRVSTRIPMQRLRARDLDGDKDRDVVLENLFSVPLAVWINDGAGHFHRGNLDEYRFQLSHDSQSFDRTGLSFPSELTDDCPRGDAVSRPSGFLSALAGVKLAVAFDDAVRVAHGSCVRTRGPPFSA